MPDECSNCRAALAGKDFVQLDADGNQSSTSADSNAYCLSCYETLFAKDCHQCSKKINVDEKHISYGGRNYHNECFACAECSKPLVDQSFVVKDGRRLCSGCANFDPESRCKRCQELFSAGQSRCTYNDDNYHEACFRCDFCETPIADRPFYIVESRFQCENCRESTAAKCRNCSKAVNGGLRFKDFTYHTECFVCTNRDCGKELAKIKFTTHTDDKSQPWPYCIPCYQDKFSERCSKCGKPVTGKYVTFGDQPYHSDCFVCHECSKSLAGEEFYQLGDEIVCATCRGD